MRALPLAARLEYHIRFTNRWMEFLDECHGACVLRDSKLAEIVAQAIMHHDGSTCSISDFVVMPNHVHILAQFQGEGEMKSFCWSSKHCTAVRIHRALRRSGHFWQPESFDHLVRSPDQFEYLQRYIAQNPAAAQLQPGESWHYQRAK